MRDQRLFLALECSLVFGGLPLVWLLLPHRFPRIPALLLLTLWCLWLLRRMAGEEERLGGNGEMEGGMTPFRQGFDRLWAAPEPGEIWRMLRFSVPFSAVACLALAWWLLPPDGLFAFPRQRPALFLAVCLLYPPLSAWPQELLYRAFFLRRYGPLFPSVFSAALASVVAFTWLHVVYGNVPAVALSFASGALFARTYVRSGSLLLVSMQHAVFGLAAFASGVGRFFYNG